MNAVELKRWRAEVNLTQAALAELVGVRENTVYRWESGKMPISRTVELAIEYIKIQFSQGRLNSQIQNSVSAAPRKMAEAIGSS